LFSSPHQAIATSPALLRLGATQLPVDDGRGPPSEDDGGGLRGIDMEGLGGEKVDGSEGALRGWRLRRTAWE
jgi:hypothetical protein